MTNVLSILPNAVSQGQAQTIYAEVNPHDPLPQSFADPLYVSMVDWSTDFSFKIENWPAIHGKTLPAAGAACLLQKDPRDNLRCLWWDGVFS